MSLSSQSSVAGTSAPDEDLAAALDEAINALQQGHSFDRAHFLSRFPQLADAIRALDHLALPTSTLGEEQIQLLEQPLPQRIGPYEIVRELGIGGFGAVYQAYDPHVKRHVALKVLHTGRLAQPEAVARFQREACATARLRHPCIVQLCDYSREGPPHYLTTEYVDGVDLRTWASRQRATPAEVAELLARIAEAIDYAHAQGVYHRDLKPGNVLVDADGTPHVLDFGLARLYQEFEDSSGAPTSEGRVLGTLAYMAPEQAAGRSHQADARSDVYSLGVILYELLTGRLPFEGPAHTLPSRVLEEHPPGPRALNPDLPRDLEAICLKALAKDPRERYRSAAALARDLRSFLRGEPVEAQPLTWIVRLQKVLSRRHRDVILHDWSKLIFFQGVTILAGCSLVNFLEWRLTGVERGVTVIGTKLVQVLVMIYLVLRYRPLADREFTSAERQIWALVPAYYGGFAALVLMNLLLEQPVPLAPVLAVLSGMAFMTLGATIWGWFYIWGAAFFGLALFIVGCAPRLGMLCLGLGWFVCLTVGSLQLRRRA